MWPPLLNGRAISDKAGNNINNRSHIFNRFRPGYLAFLCVFLYLSINMQQKRHSCIQWRGCILANDQTTYLGLNQWDRDDPFVRVEFNEDNRKVDAALAGKAEQESLDALSSVVDTLSSTVALHARIHAGAYTGNGESPRFIDVGFPVKAVLVEYPKGDRALGSSGVFGGLAVLGWDMGNGKNPAISVSGDGFFIYNQGGGNGSLNSSREVYYYVAFG